MMAEEGGKLMYDELIKRVRQVAEEVCDDYDVDPYIAEQRYFVIEEAADAIEELVATVGTAYNELANNEANKPRWIPVTERLPKESERVLVACEDGVSFGFFEEIIADDEFDEFVKEWHDMMYYPISVTHWMPLPEPPKEE